MEVAGPQAQWPAWTADQVFKQVSLSVRGGSTGKPDRLQEQDRWTKLLPVIKEAMAQVAELRTAGQDDMAEAVVELVTSPGAPEAAAAATPPALALRLREPGCWSRSSRCPGTWCPSYSACLCWWRV